MAQNLTATDKFYKIVNDISDICISLPHPGPLTIIFIELMSACKDAAFYEV